MTCDGRHVFWLPSVQNRNYSICLLPELYECNTIFCMGDSSSTVLRRDRTSGRARRVSSKHCIVDISVGINHSQQLLSQSNSESRIASTIHTPTRTVTGPNSQNAYISSPLMLIHHSKTPKRSFDPNFNIYSLTRHTVVEMSASSKN